MFAITKSAKCQGKADCTSLDLNAANTDITYAIKVANVTTDYSADATNVIFRDVLPAGMELIPGTVTVGGVTVPSSSYTVTTVNGIQTLQGVIPELKVGTDLTVEFKVKVDKAILSAAGTAKNEVTLYDNFDGTTPNPDSPNGSDITDSTDDNTDTPKVPADGEGTPGKDTSSTIIFTDRNLTIKDNDAKEIGVSGNKVTYTQTITNNGNANEGGADRPITISITDPNGNALSIDKTAGNAPYYTTDGGTTKTPLIDNNDGTYKLPDDVIIPKDGSVDIVYTVASNGQSTGPVGGATNDIGKSEANIVTLTLGGATPPAASSVTNTTTIQGVELIKTQALDVGCAGTVGAFGTTDLNGIPGDCIVYKISANNTFSVLDVTKLLISDVLAQFSVGATYRNDVTSETSSASSNISVPANSDGTTISTTVGKLTPADTATMKFSVKINEYSIRN